MRVIRDITQALNGKQATWAAKKYQGHRIIPETIMQEIEWAFVD